MNIKSLSITLSIVFLIGYFRPLFGQLCPDGMVFVDGLRVEDLGKAYTPHPSKVPPFLSAGKSDLGGNTSVRRLDAESLPWKSQGYFQRNRELGQIFNIPVDTFFQLDAIVLRTGNGKKAVLDSTPGASVHLQIFEVMGIPVINDNGTPQGTESTHGFNTNHRTDDFLEGIEYRSMAVVKGGIFPDIEPTSQSGGQPGHLRYMRWDVPNEAQIVFEGGKRYAFMVGFERGGPGHGFTLGNDNEAASGAIPDFRYDINGEAWWSIRREGDGTLPPTQFPGASPPADPSVRQSLIEESLFDSTYLCSLSPTTDGYPDVDTYRSLEFYIEVKNGCEPVGTVCNDGDSTTINDAFDGFCNCFGEVENGCQANGKVNYNRYDGQFRFSISSLKASPDYPENPDESLSLNFIETPSNVGNIFGARIHGYICPPLSGFYTFYIAGDDHVELNLSSDAAEENVQRIAYHLGNSGLREWNKYPTQRSLPIKLVAGQNYFFEAIMKDDEGADHMSVAWKLPNGTFQGPIPGSFLASEVECNPVGTPCDDNNPNTQDDRENGSCGCVGTNICEAEGVACDDNNPFTEGDKWDGFCECKGTVISTPGLELQALGTHYERIDVLTPQYLFFDQADQGGSTSVRNVDQASLSWKGSGYFQRNRDLGQSFTIPEDTSFVLDAIVLRTGNSASAVKLGAIGAEVYLQLFEVEGNPTINDNGTPIGTESTHGFTSNHRADDYLEGVNYSSIRLATGGFFPVIGPTSQNGGQNGHLHYIRWDLTGDNEIILEGGKTYAFMVGFVHPAPLRSFTLANQNLAADPGPPQLRTDSNQSERWSIRREGDGTLPPTQVPGDSPPLDGELLESLFEESLFEIAHEYTLQPTTNGFPDVDTYRTLEFYIETKTNESTATRDVDQLSQIVAFPNPSQGQISLSIFSELSQDGLLSIVDISGKLIFEKEANISPREEYALDLRGKIEPGLYFITFRSNQGIFQKKIVVQ